MTIAMTLPRRFVPALSDTAVLTTARVILGATLLRALTIANALASVRAWGRRISPRLLLADCGDAPAPS